MHKGWGGYSRMIYMVIGETRWLRRDDSGKFDLAKEQDARSESKFDRVEVELLL